MPDTTMRTAHSIPTQLLHSSKMPSPPAFAAINRLIVILLLAITTIPSPAQSPLEMAVGDAVDVYAKDGIWYPARIVAVMPDGRPRVRYDGYGAESDEIVDPRAVRLRKGLDPMPFDGPAGPAQPRIAPPPFPDPQDQPEDDFMPALRAGSRVEVFAKGRWFEATIITRVRARAEVVYDGFEYREWVDLVPDWVRPLGAQLDPGENQPAPPTGPGEIRAPATSPDPGLQPFLPGQSTPPPLSDEDLAAPIGLFLMSRTIGDITENRAYLFAGDGSTFENPFGGSDPFDAAAFRAATPASSGKAGLSGGTLSVRWDAGRPSSEGPLKTWSGGDGFDWLGGSFRRVPPLTPDDLVGNYKRLSGAVELSIPGPSELGAIETMAFQADGSYRAADATGAGEAGIYTASGNTLRLTVGGMEKRQTAFVTAPGAGGSVLLYLDGTFFKRESAIP